MKDELDNQTMDLIETKGQDLAAKLSVSELAISDLENKIKDLQKEKKKMTDSIETFKDDLREAMVESGVHRIENEEYGILFRLDKPSVKVEVDEENLIPDKFFKVVRQLDKMAVKKALQVGDDVNGAKLVEGKHRLTVKL